jgi:biotin-(acetyl-CoA carboxylase) ligase
MKKLPMKWFPQCIAQIRFRKVDKWAEQFARNGITPYFDTWEEAHAYMLQKAITAETKATKALASAKRHLERVKALKKPKQEPTHD